MRSAIAQNEGELLGEDVGEILGRFHLRIQAMLRGFVPAARADKALSRSIRIDFAVLPPSIRIVEFSSQAQIPALTRALEEPGVRPVGNQDPDHSSSCRLSRFALPSS